MTGELAQIQLLVVAQMDPWTVAQLPQMQPSIVVLMNLSILAQLAQMKSLMVAQMDPRIADQRAQMDPGAVSQLEDMDPNQQLKDEVAEDSVAELAGQNYLLEKGAFCHSHTWVQHNDPNHSQLAEPQWLQLATHNC